MPHNTLLDKLVNTLCVLPGVGQKSAQRMALHLLQRKRAQAKELASTIQLAMTNIDHCKACQLLTEEEMCYICTDKRRDPTQLCIVESPSDLFSIEQTATYRGTYFVLTGHLSPIDGIGPTEIGIPLLEQKLEQSPISEIIMATNPTVEGDATAHYISDLIKSKSNIKITRIAFGVPIGSELEYTDQHTLSRAMEKRELISSH